MSDGMIFSLVIVGLVNVVLIAMFIWLCNDVGNIKKILENQASAATYIKDALEKIELAGNYIKVDAWQRDMFYGGAKKQAQKAIVDLKIAKYYIDRGNIGKLSDEVMKDYDGEIDLVEFLHNYIQTQIDDVKKEIIDVVEEWKRATSSKQ